MRDCHDERRVVTHHSKAKCSTNPTAALGVPAPWSLLDFLTFSTFDPFDLSLPTCFLIDGCFFFFFLLTRQWLVSARFSMAQQLTSESHAERSNPSWLTLIQYHSQSRLHRIKQAWFVLFYEYVFNCCR